MIGRRLIYGAALLAAFVLHFAYGQYVTFYILLFLLFLPVLSLLLSLPAILSSRADLIGGADVSRGRACSVKLRLESRFFLPPELYKVKIEQKNLFLERRGSCFKIQIYGIQKHEEVFTPDTSCLGTVCYRICSARACDYLGLFAIPIKRSGTAALTVLPNAERPVPEPELTEASDRVLKPKPIGFSEEHELRPYREGDAVNLIHWKLTEKTDTPIVREPQEQIRKNIVLCMDLTENYPAEESMLEQLKYLSDLLIEEKIPFLLRYGWNSVQIGGEGDFNRFLKSFLSKMIREEAAQPVSGGSDTLVYRIIPKKEARI